MKVKEVDLYSALIVVAHTQGAQVRITQFYLQLHLTCLYLVSIHQMAPPKTEVADIYNCSLLLIYLPRKDERYKQDTCTQCTYNMTLYHHTSLQHDS